jgi:hypothetical protein
MTNLMIHRNNVVEVVSESNGMATVRFVSRHPSLSGLARRGRRPHYSDPVSVSELTPAGEEVLTALAASEPSRA